MNTILLFALPPLLGAIIGWVTNALAIKMLFRPLQAKHIGKLRIPFTPGILPRQRHQLARNIGRMVQRELITEDMLRERLDDPAVQSGIRDGIASSTERLLAMSPQELWDGLDTFLRARFGQGGAALLEQALSRLLDSPSFDAMLSRLVEALSTPLFEQSLGDILHHLDSALAERPTLESPRIAALIEGLWPQLCDKILSLLSEPQVRRALEQRGRVFLDETIQSLSSVQRFFISAAQYDASLARRMPQIIDSLVEKIADYLASSEGRDVVVRRASTALSAWLSGKPSQILSRLVGDSSSHTLRSFLEQQLGVDSATLPARVSKALAEGLRTRGASGIVSRLEAWARDRGDLPVSTLFPASRALKEGIDRHATGLLVSFAHEKLPQALAGVDIEGLVVKRIDSLEMDRVERIVLDVLSGQLKWINVFGAILGALIGGFQVAISLFWS